MKKINNFENANSKSVAAIHASLSLQIITCSAKFESFLKNTVFANGSFLFVYTGLEIIFIKFYLTFYKLCVNVIYSVK